MGDLNGVEREDGLNRRGEELSREGRKEGGVVEMKVNSSLHRPSRQPPWESEALQCKRVQIVPELPLIAVL